jgi:Homeodomain-like domain
MQTPLFVRPLTADERATLETGLRSSSAFTVRRCQILLASAEGQSTPMIARELRCPDQTVRNTLHAFHQRGYPLSPGHPVSSMTCREGLTTLPGHGQLVDL